MLRETDLRARRKVAAMRHIQSAAVELFLERGFDAVTIEQVAAAAEVSPSTVYRYFGTKEGLVLHDDHDDELFALAPQLLADHDPVTAFLVGVDRIGTTHQRDGDIIRLRTDLWFSTPSIRAAGYLMADEITDALTDVLLASPRNELTRSQARTLLGALMGGLLASIRSWIEDGGTEDVRARLTADLTAIAATLPLRTQ
ncbi:MAG: helix-turn-helix domain-containing protein [Dermatophilaceae bacterium]